VRVAEMAKVARGSLLHQFPTRIDLILAVADFAARVQGQLIREGLGDLPPGRERFIASVDATWAAFKSAESRALLEITVATRYDPELAARIPDFAERYQAGVARAAQRFATNNGLVDEKGEATAERRLMLVALRGLAAETALSGPDANPAPVLALLKRLRADFYDSHVAKAG
jgi:AcrR family transcriptional regulator